VKITIKMDGVDAEIKRLETYGAEVHEELRATLHEAATKMTKDAKKDAPYKDGGLKKSIRWYMRGGLWAIVRAGGRGVDYAQYQEYGTLHISAKYYMTWNHTKWGKWFLYECKKIPGRAGAT